MANSQVPVAFLLAFKQLQTAVDIDYKVTGSDLSTGQDLLNEIGGKFSSISGLQGLATLFTDMNVLSVTDHNSTGLNFLNAMIIYNRAADNDPMTQLWQYIHGTSDPDSRSMVMKHSMSEVEFIFNTWGKDYYDNKNPPTDSKGNPTGATTPQSQLEIIQNDAGQAQTYLQTATQTNTAEIQQDIQTSESYDKVGQSIVTSVNKGTQTMVGNQKST
ncbi:MAG: hypothetical protein SP1CHLAM54_17730 [Chlamydiia bacterium]|nr:hypothetical protein [Chlamydiia bacterium]MCH9616661.1 hypothetical protein [Chlamydiia bacterium]MCH9629392.1 hypothetical protein [Chlamydiia bacterium]